MTAGDSADQSAGLQVLHHVRALAHRHTDCRPDQHRQQYGRAMVRSIGEKQDNGHRDQRHPADRRPVGHAGALGDDDPGQPEPESTGQGDQDNPRQPERLCGDKADRAENHDRADHREIQIFYRKLLGALLRGFSATAAERGESLPDRGEGQHDAHQRPADHHADPQGTVHLGVSELHRLSGAQTGGDPAEQDRQRSDYPVGQYPADQYRQAGSAADKPRSQAEQADRPDIAEIGRHS